MKKILIAGFATALVATSCSTISNGKTAQDNRVEFLKMKGDWEIVSINFDKGIKIKPFDEGVDSKCFVGSQWKLIPNNYTGSYTTSDQNGCISRTQPIKFEVVNGNTFQFKKIAEGTKAKQNSAGYELTLVNQTADQFSLKQVIPFEGKTIDIIYNFQKTSLK